MNELFLFFREIWRASLLAKVFCQPILAMWFPTYINSPSKGDEENGGKDMKQERADGCSSDLLRARAKEVNVAPFNSFLGILL